MTSREGGAVFEEDGLGGHVGGIADVAADAPAAAASATDEGADRERHGECLEDEGETEDAEGNQELCVCAVVMWWLDERADAFVERERRTGDENENGRKERPEERFLAVAVRVFLVRRGIRKVDADEEEHLVHCVGDGVPGFREHCGTAGGEARPQLADGNREVRAHGGEDGRLALFGHMGSMTPYTRRGKRHCAEARHLTRLGDGWPHSKVLQLRTPPAPARSA